MKYYIIELGESQLKMKKIFRGGFFYYGNFNNRNIYNYIIRNICIFRFYWIYVYTTNKL
nr:MAG TPA: hypothetical protein [Caudoviricetes sp.]